ncbi:MAG: hypothetical protein JSR67_03760 [Proteobacteria bacterium]|nr:hypothetical protein [Pseudomonadota bacterium]
MTETDTLAGELWLLDRISNFCNRVKHAFAGTTHYATRKQRMRAAIALHGLECAICGRDSKSRAAFTFAQAFERLYGEKL